MALERVPADIRRDGGVARMSDPDMIRDIQEAVTDPGDGEVPDRPLRRGAGAAALDVDYIDESEVLTPADDEHHVYKTAVQGAVRLRLHATSARRSGASAKARR